MNVLTLWCVLLTCPLAGCAIARRASQERVVQGRQMSLRGLEAMQASKWDDAEQLLRRAITTCPSDPRAQSCYSEVLWHRGEPAQAIKHMEEAVRLSGGEQQLLMRLGQMHLDRGQLFDAMKQADVAIENDRQFPDAWVLKGDVQMRLGQEDEALGSYHRALSHEPHSPRVQLAMAELYRKKGKPTRSLAILHALSDRYPSGQVPTDVLVQEGQTLADLQRHDDAAAKLAVAAQREPRSADLLLKLSEVQLQAGQHNEARQSLLAALKLEPKHVASQQLLTRLDSQQRGLTASLRR